MTDKKAAPVVHNNVLSESGNLLKSALLGVASILACWMVGFYAYYETHDAVVENLKEESNNFAHLLVYHIENMESLSTQSEVIDELQREFQKIESRYPGRYLCAIDPEANLIYHTQKPQVVGKNVGHVRIYPDSTAFPQTLKELLQAKQSWAGGNFNLRGEEQVAAYVYTPLLDGLVVFHVPQKIIDTEIYNLTWAGGIGLALITFLLMPLAVVLMHRIYSKAQQQLLEREAEQLERERFETMVQTTNNIAHQLDAPMQTMAGHIADLEWALGEGREVQGEVAAIKSEFARIRDVFLKIQDVTQKE